MKVMKTHLHSQGRVFNLDIKYWILNIGYSILIPNQLPAQVPLLLIRVIQGQAQAS